MKDNTPTFRHTYGPTVTISSNLRVFCWTWIFLVSSCVLLPLELWAEANSPDRAQVAQLIVQLGANEFVLREDATRKLFELGVKSDGDGVLDAITAATNESDREIRQRAFRIKNLLEDHLQEKKLKAFVAGKAVATPGWKDFSEKFGNTKSSRSIYAVILDSEWKMIELCFNNSKMTDVGSANKPEPVPANQDDAEPTAADLEAYAQRRQVINQRFAQLLDRQRNFQLLPLGSLLSFYYVGEKFPESFDLKSQLFFSMNAPSLATYFRRGKRGENVDIVRKLVSDWMVKTVQTDPRYETQALAASLAQGMPDVCKVIAKLILKRENSLPVNKRSAMLAATSLRDKSAIEYIEPYLKDPTPLTKNRTRNQQLGDIALACAMDLRGFDVQKHLGVKLSATSNRSVRRSFNYFDYSTLGFRNQEERAKALELYQQLIEAQKRDEEKPK